MQRETTKQNFIEESREEACVLFMVWTKKKQEDDTKSQYVISP